MFLTAVIHLTSSTVYLEQVCFSSSYSVAFSWLPCCLMSGALIFDSLKMARSRWQMLLLTLVDISACQEFVFEAEVMVRKHQLFKLRNKAILIISLRFFDLSFISNTEGFISFFSSPPSSASVAKRNPMLHHQVYLRNYLPVLYYDIYCVASC